MSTCVLVWLRDIGCTLNRMAGATGRRLKLTQLWLIKLVCTHGAQANPDNRLLQVRGNACTHDVALGSETLRALVAAAADEDGPGAGAKKGKGAGVAVPRYDKAAHGGRGDRAPRDAWPRVRGPVDLVSVPSGSKVHALKRLVLDRGSQRLHALLKLR